ncbi:MAG: hypothetical protein PWQ96_2110 [Clostridia bacterium]|nr:hypothetical protein [Clostridiales bacterium]MDK2986466.1 hypothetical protein [Clostridia bacterium]
MNREDKRKIDRWNEEAARMAEKTQIKRKQFWRGVNRPHQGIAADKEKFLHENLTGAHKVLHPDSKGVDE